MTAIFLDRKLLILLSLLDGPKHGYALMKDVEEEFGVRMGPGTLYGCIGSLEHAGLIVALAADERKRPYSITALGEARAKKDVAEVARVTTVALTRIATL